MEDKATGSAFQVMSPVFQEGTAIPEQYTCKGQNINPPLNILHAPAGTQSFTLILHDPDAPSGDFLHWLIWDIPPSTQSISVNSVPIGAVQGPNGMGKNNYMGPCPPSGRHRYMFELYALDKMLNLKPDTTRDQLQKAMEGHILEKAILTGVFSTS